MWSCGPPAWVVAEVEQARLDMAGAVRGQDRYDRRVVPVVGIAGAVRAVFEEDRRDIFRIGDRRFSGFGQWTARTNYQLDRALGKVPIYKDKARLCLTNLNSRGAAERRS